MLDLFWSIEIQVMFYQPLHIFYPMIYGNWTEKSAMHFISVELSPQKLEKITLTPKLLQLWVRGRMTNQSGAGKVYRHASVGACLYILQRID